MQNELPFAAEFEPAPEPQGEDLSAVAETAPLDCSRILARHMLRAAMGKASQPLSLGLYIVQAPSAEWCAPLEEVVRDVYLGAPRP